MKRSKPVRRSPLLAKRGKALRRASGEAARRTLLFGSLADKPNPAMRGLPGVRTATGECVRVQAAALKKLLGASRLHGKRKGIRRQGKRSKREQAQAQAFREAVLGRGYCQECHSWEPGFREPCPQCRFRGLVAHHCCPRSKAKAAWKHNPEINGACLCERHHRSVHDHTEPNWKNWLLTTAQVQERYERSLRA